MKKILTIVGARPQFIKAAAVSRVIREKFSKNLREVIVHTGQHYDDNMSAVFFEELGIPKPDYNLSISQGGHGEMTGRMLEKIEAVLFDEKPDWVLIYGDTNSTLAGALAAAKLHIPVAHVEAGLRSFNKRMPEEINRILSDNVSKLLFCPTKLAVQNLLNEGITEGVHTVGDVMYDVALHYREKAQNDSSIFSQLNLAPKRFVLATCHRAENTDDINRLRSILEALGSIAEKLDVVLPLHPRTKLYIEKFGLHDLLSPLKTTEPLSFLKMVALEQSAFAIVTDSGGVQKEAYFYQVPCITMRDETEWAETVELGWNSLVGADTNKIITAFSNLFGETIAYPNTLPYGDGKAAEKIVQHLIS